MDEQMIELIARAIVTARGGNPDECVSGWSWEAGEMGRSEAGSVCSKRNWELCADDARAAHSVIAGKVAELEGAAQQAADALYPFISMIAHAFDEDGRHYWTRDPTEAEGKAAIDATYAVSAALAPYPERR